VMLAKPHSASAIHHHGEEGTALQEHHSLLHDDLCIGSWLSKRALI
jgi:hypothetical protein